MKSLVSANKMEPVRDYLGRDSSRTVAKLPVPVPVAPARKLAAPAESASQYSHVTPAPNFARAEVVRGYNNDHSRQASSSSSTSSSIKINSSTDTRDKKITSVKYRSDGGSSDSDEYSHLEISNVKRPRLNSTEELSSAIREPSSNTLLPI